MGAMGNQALNVLIANRGEIARRIARAVSDAGGRSVAVFAAGDTGHLRYADLTVELPGNGPAAYMDTSVLVEIARKHGCDAIHPGYGFRAEDAEFARATEAAGLIFVGPRPETLTLFGDKIAAREFAAANDLPVLSGTGPDDSFEDALALFDQLGNDSELLIKAAAGGGGRGMRAVARSRAASTSPLLAVFGPIKTVRAPRNVGAPASGRSTATT